MTSPIDMTPEEKAERLKSIEKRLDEIMDFANVTVLLCAKEAVEEQRKKEKEENEKMDE